MPDHSYAHTHVNAPGEVVSIIVMRDGRFLEPMTDIDQADVMTAAACMAYPETGYDTDQENQAASLFTALCQMVKHYSEEAYGPSRGPGDMIDIETTLMAIKENVLP